MKVYILQTEESVDNSYYKCIHGVFSTYEKAEKAMNTLKEKGDFNNIEDITFVITECDIDVLTDSYYTSYFVTSY